MKFMLVKIFKMKLDSRFMLEHLCYDQEEVTFVHAFNPRVRWVFWLLGIVFTPFQGNTNKNKSKRPVDALAVKAYTTHLLTT